MDQNVLVITAGILLSALFSWVPRLNVWFNALTDNNKRLVMFLSLAAAVGAIFGAGCANFVIPGVTLSVTCDQSGFKELAQLLAYAVVSNQTAFLLLPKPK